MPHVFSLYFMISYVNWTCCDGPDDLGGKETNYHIIRDILKFGVSV